MSPHRKWPTTPSWAKCSASIEGGLVEVRPHQHQRVRVQMLTAQRLFANERLEVEEQGTVATAHVAQPLRLALERGVKNRPDHLVKMTGHAPWAPPLPQTFKVRST